MLFRNNAIFLTLSIFATCFAVPGQADVTGQSTFTFADNTTEWFTQSREIRGKLRHSATLEKGRLFDRVEVTSYPKETDSRERLEISMVFVHGPLASSTEEYLRPSDITIKYLLGAMTGPQWEARDISMTFTLAEESDIAGTLVGEFEAVFCYHEEIYADADIDSCETGSGRFETAIVIQRDD